MHWVSCPLRSKLRACSRALWAEAKRSDAGRRAPCACCAAVGPPRFWFCTSCGEAAPPCVASFIAAVGGCCSRTVSSACGDPPPALRGLVHGSGGRMLRLRRFRCRRGRRRAWIRGAHGRRRQMLSGRGSNRPRSWTCASVPRSQQLCEIFNFCRARPGRGRAEREHKRARSSQQRDCFHDVFPMRVLKP